MKEVSELLKTNIEIELKKEDYAKVEDLDLQTIYAGCALTEKSTSEKPQYDCRNAADLQFITLCEIEIADGTYADFKRSIAL